MENVGYASLQIIPSMKGFESKLSSGTSGPLSSAGSKGGRLFGNSAGKSMTASIASHAKKAAFLGAAAFTAVGVAAFKLTKDSIAEARESQKVGALTTSVIKSTGKAANVTAKQVGDLSTALSLKSGIDDEVIQSGANMLLTFKDIRNEAGKNNDIFNQSVAITQDMAAAMAGGKGGEIDLKSSSILVGKALNDPIKGLSALSRVGVSFTDQQKTQIKALVESGKTMEAQKIILGELKSEFGGAAAAQATMGEKVKTAWGNIQEQIGTALLPLVDKLERAFLKKGVPAIQGMVDAFAKKGVPALKHFGKWVATDGVDKLEDFYRSAKPVAQDVLPAIFDLLKASRPILKTSAGLVGDLAQAFTKIPHWAQVAIAGGLLAGKAGGFKITTSLIGKSLASKAAPLPVFVVNQVPGAGVPGTPGRGVPPIVPAGVPKALPKWAPFIPIGLESAPGQDSLMKKLFGFGPGGGEGEGVNKKLALPPEVKKSIDEAAHAYDNFGQNATAAFRAVEGALAKSQNHVKEYQHILGLTPKQVTTMFELNGIDRAIAQADTLNAKLRAAADTTRGLDNGVTYQHGGTSGSSGGSRTLSGQVDDRVSAHYGSR